MITLRSTDGTQRLVVIGCVFIGKPEILYDLGYEAEVHDNLWLYVPDHWWYLREWWSLIRTLHKLRQGE